MHPRLSLKAFRSPDTVRPISIENDMASDIPIRPLGATGMMVSARTASAYLMMQSATKAIVCPGKHRVGR